MYETELDRLKAECEFKAKNLQIATQALVTYKFCNIWLLKKYLEYLHESELSAIDLVIHLQERESDAPPL